MRARKVDANLQEIVKSARKMGFKINIRNDSMADLDAQLCGLSEIWECKGKGGRFTPLQDKMRENGWQIRTIRTVDDLLQARSEMTRAASAIQKTRMGD